MRLRQIRGKRSVRKGVRQLQQQESYASLLEEVETLFGWLNRHVVIGQEAAATLLKLALLTRQHLLLEGPPGVAKSRMATAVFTAFPNCSHFKKLFTGDTLPDEVVGPMNPVLLRTKGEVRFNTRGLLPTAQFAVLEEFFNAGRALRGALYTILNERQFTNGSEVEACPLWTAVACTNHVPDTEEDYPVVDRFIFRAKVNVATSAEQRFRILDSFQDSADGATLISPVQLELAALQSLHAGVCEVALTQDMLHLLEKLHSEVTEVGRSLGWSHAISDRRYCWAYRTLQAMVFLSSQGDLTAPQEPSCLYEVAHVLIADPAATVVVQAKIAALLQTIQARSAQQQLLESAEQDLSTYGTEYAVDAKPAILKRLYRGILRLEDQLANPLSSTGAAWTDTTFEALANRLLAGVRGMRATLEANLPSVLNTLVQPSTAAV